ncbi:hypothetical protein WAJ14_21005, partial [Acinetobacter baumannii]
NQKMAEKVAKELAASEAKKGAVNKEEQKVSSDDAAAVSQELYSLINAHFDGGLSSNDAGEDNLTTAAQAPAAADASVSEDQDVSE